MEILLDLSIDEKGGSLKDINALDKEIFPYEFFIDNFSSIREIIMEFWAQSWARISSSAPDKSEETKKRYARQRGLFPAYKEGAGRPRDPMSDFPAIRTGALRDMFFFTEESKGAGVSYVNPEGAVAVTEIFVTAINTDGFVNEYAEHYMNSFLGDYEDFIIDGFVSTDEWMNRITELVYNRITSAIKGLGLG